MKLRLGLGLALMLCVATEAAEPVAALPAAPAPKTVPAKRLDLRIGDVRRYMTPDEYREAISAPDADRNTVVVQGERAPPLQSEQPVPAGLMGLWYAAKKPSQAWRIFLPDPKAPPIGPPTVVPPPVFRWGP